MLTSQEIVKKLEGTSTEAALKTILRRLLHYQQELERDNVETQGQLYNKVAESQEQAKIIFDTINLMTDSKIGYWLDLNTNICHFVDWSTDTETILVSFDLMKPPY